MRAARFTNREGGLVGCHQIAAHQTVMKNPHLQKAFSSA
jgi:hypothetical protein